MTAPPSNSNLKQAEEASSWRQYPANASAALRGAYASLLEALPAIFAYVVLRVLALVPLYDWMKGSRKHWERLLTSFDASWYVEIAEEGYSLTVGRQSSMAFFPLLPRSIRLVAKVFHLEYEKAGVLVSAVAALFAVWGIFALGKHLHNARTGIVLVMLWAVLPHAVLQQMVYSEGMFTAFVAWTMLALLRRNWLAAGLLCAVAGFTRPTASALVATVGLSALVSIIQRRDGLRPWIAGVLAPCGWVSYLWWVSTQREGGWFEIQRRGWGTKFDFGSYTFDMFLRNFYEPGRLQLYVVSIVLLTALVLQIISILQRVPWQIVLFNGMLLAATVGTEGFYHSKARLLVPAFSLLLPPAVGLAKLPSLRVGLTLLVPLFICASYTCYLFVEWRRSF